jgi:hypothetical protein
MYKGVWKKISLAPENFIKNDFFFFFLNEQMLVAATTFRKGIFIQTFENSIESSSNCSLLNGVFEKTNIQQLHKISLNINSFLKKKNVRHSEKVFSLKFKNSTKILTLFHIVLFCLKKKNNNKIAAGKFHYKRALMEN